MNILLPEELDAMLVEGLRSGEWISVDTYFWKELKQEAMARLADRKKTPGNDPLRHPVAP